MQWIIILCGLGLLLLAVIFRHWFHRRRMAAMNHPSPYCRPYCRLKTPKKPLHLLKRAVRITSDATLHDSARRLLEYILVLQKEVRHLPALPCCEDNEPRLMALARKIADSDQITQETMLNLLADWEPAVPGEIAALPICVKSALCDRLSMVLVAIIRDAQEKRTAQKLSRRICKLKAPITCLRKYSFSPAGFFELISFLQDRECHEQLAALEEYLNTLDTSPEEVIQRATHRKVQLAEEIRRTTGGFEMLSSVDWLAISEDSDPIHPLLAADPRDIYPHMSQVSKLDLRLLIEKTSRRFKMPAEELLQYALHLSQDSEPRSLENYIGYWFQDADGLRQLHQTLPAKHGKLYARLALRTEELWYAALCVLGFIAGFIFLQGRQPVFMLPFFLLTAGSYIRQLFPAKAPNLPSMSATFSQDDLRILVVLPDVLNHPQDAIRSVRRLKVAQKAFPEKNTDFLLLSDFGENMTPVSSTDAAIIHAASSAIEALNDSSRFLYIQRARTWNSNRHIYAAHGGQLGAIREICRLIAHGECKDSIAYASVAPAALERRYAYILVLAPDKRPAPDMLSTLLQRMIHPLSAHYPSPRGQRGYAVLSAKGQGLFDGTGLIHPTAYIEATDGILNDASGAEALAGELAGHAGISASHCHTIQNDDAWGVLYREAQANWRLLRWQLPYVQTPSGLVTNPLGYFSRFRLREMLRRNLVPCARFVLLIWAILVDNWLLLLLAALAPGWRVPFSTLQRKDILSFCHQLSSLPMRSLISIQALIDLFRRPAGEPSWNTMEIWAQWVSATLLIALGVALPHMTLPALLIGLLFACYPWFKQLSSAKHVPAEEISEEQSALLEDLAAKTWRFFSDNVSAETAHLPPADVQFEPHLGQSDETSPEAISAYLLSCICAKELGLINAASAAERIQLTLESAAKLPLPYGLPCRRYHLNPLLAADAGTDAASTGFLVAGLMTTAQALRTWLPELPSAYENLSATAERIIDTYDLSRLYDPQANLFHRGLDQDGQPFGVIDCFTDETLLLSVAAWARKVIPPLHFHALRQPASNWHGKQLFLSQYGNASPHLLASLFLPCGDNQTMPYIHAMIRHGRQGLWGQDQCGRYAFAPDLHYLKERFGLAEAALSPTEAAPVYTPYAAALCLPHEPRLAADALLQFKAHGALGPSGMCDAFDFSHGGTLIGMYDSFHQGLLLVAVAHVLADRPVQRIFSHLPQVEACLPLLDQQPSVLLPHIPVDGSQPPASFREDIIANLSLDPPHSILLGSNDFHMLVNARGSSAIFEHDMPLTAWEPLAPANGIQFYLADEGRWYWLGDVGLTGQTVFSAGEVRSEKLCGSLKAELICTVDTLRHRTLHIMTITNLSTQDRIIEAADCLLPDMDVPANTLEAARPAKKHLTLHARGTDRTLHHCMAISQPELSLHVCSDQLAFVNRSGTLENPGSLSEAPEDVVASTITPCLSFRIKLCLGGRSQATLWFTTSTMDVSVPTFSELTGIRRLAAMQHDAISAAASLTSEQTRAATMLVGMLHENNRHITFTLHERSGFQVLMDLVHIVGMFLLHGFSFRVDVLCDGSLILSVQEALRDQLAEDMIQFNPESTLSRTLTLHSASPLIDQLLALHRPYPPATLPPRRPTAALLPMLTLDFSGRCGGFHPETGTYVIQLEPGQTTPAPWPNVHCHAHYREEVDDSGIRTPFEEQLFLRMADGALFSPWTSALPRTIHMDAGITSWETWTDVLDVKLTAAAMPGHRCGMRVLRIRNASDKPIDLQVYVQARFISQAIPLECAPCVVMTQHPLGRMHAYLAGTTGISRRLAYDRRWDQSDDPEGSYALLEFRMTVEPNASQEALWVSGWARHAEDVAAALHSLNAEGASSLLHRVRAQWAQRLGGLTISTPEDSLDQLMNHILPLQAITSNAPERILTLNHLAPYEAKRTLLKTARLIHSRQDWARFASLLRSYVQLTGDSSVLDVHLSSHNMALLDHCALELLSLPKDPRGLPLGEAPARTCLIMAAAAQALDALRSNPQLQEFARKLLNAADTYLWQDGCYGEPLRLDVQHLACTAYGVTPRTRQAVQTAWAALYDRPHGLIRAMDAADLPPLPGLPENGGMVTTEAVGFLRALLKTDHTDDAHELLRALNPIHHTDDPLRQNTFREAPYRLHGGMYAAPLEAGRATPNGGAAAAALLYDTVLQDVLGLHRRGNVIRIIPHVPQDWDDYTITLQESASTWHISVERRIKQLTIDGVESADSSFTIVDDGRVHQIRIPLA